MNKRVALIGQQNHVGKKATNRAVVVAQLVEQLLPTPKVRGSNPVIGKIY